MKKQNTQRGSVHIFIIIVLVIVLVAALGFIFWQKIIIKPASSASTKVTGTAKSTSDTQKTFAFPKWDVEAVVDNDSGVALGDYGGPTADYLSTYQFVAAEGTIKGCYPSIKGSPTDLGEIVRYNADDVASGGSKTWRQLADSTNEVMIIGNYAYIFISPQQGCGDPNTSAGQQANDRQSALSDEVKTILHNLKG